MSNFGTLTDYKTGETLRPATVDEWRRSVNSGDYTGAFLLDDRPVFVEGGPEPVLVGDTYETLEDAAQYAEDEAEALRMLGAEDA